MIYGYARVSTIGQERNGNSLNDQRQKLKEAGCEIIVAEQYTGTKAHRPKFDELLQKLQNGDTLIVTKMDRFARNATDANVIAQSLLDKGVTFNILNMGIMNNTPMGRLMKTMLLGFAEFERDMIVQRTQEGKALARQKEGYREGRPAIAKEKTNHAVELINNGCTYKEVATLTGLSKSTIIRAVRRYRAEQTK